MFKTEKQSPWGVLWKGVPKNYPKFTEKHLNQSLYRLEACNFMKKASARACFRHLLRAVPAPNALFQFLRVFSHSKTLEFACCLGGFHFLICPFLFIPQAGPVFLKYTLPTQAISGEFWKVFKNIYFVEQLQTAVFLKINVSTFSYLL